jgi:hypothetical protein
VAKSRDLATARRIDDVLVDGLRHGEQVLEIPRQLLLLEEFLGIIKPPP